MMVTCQMMRTSPQSYSYHASDSEDEELDETTSDDDYELEAAIKCKP